MTQAEVVTALVGLAGLVVGWAVNKAWPWLSKRWDKNAVAAEKRAAADMAVAQADRDMLYRLLERQTVVLEAMGEVIPAMTVHVAEVKEMTSKVLLNSEILVDRRRQQIDTMTVKSVEVNSGPG